jgi:putative addiction module component (TIGR02574 family)
MPAEVRAMSKDEVLQQLLALPENDRREVIDAALDSVGDRVSEEEVDPELVELLNERLADHDAHPEEAVPWEVVKEEMRRAVDEVRAERLKARSA